MPLRAAGGPLAEADLDDINIAARLIDNTTLYIPFKVFSQQDGRALVARRTPTAAEMNLDAIPAAGGPGWLRNRLCRPMRPCRPKKSRRRRNRLPPQAA